ncbi:type VII secretion-associated serine protease mycosin [Actinoplanes sp. KI2]|uniref:type VII secretion-associated serine protease mycosin n=1 Tax=Actinoplanes sp. KI2 TaxID=2983315 RepID=UPI0021D60485|nr:type VII secretion-associated serine protease mycosin [Actinoplanes sp. KI2]MCU7722565.1 type VII secretion-associated serine protease mycosin [Actinoplanes sp. KI2]
MRWARLAAVAVTVLAVLVAPAPAQAVCDPAPPTSQTVKGTPIEDRVYAPERLAPLATGRGIRIAVIDSGVDPDHPQLRGQVLDGADFLHGGPDGKQDCVGHGTAVASIIAAAPAGGTGFRGLAPGARIVPIRVSEQTEDAEGNLIGESGSQQKFAQAIDFAVEQAHVQVINLSLVLPGDSQVVDAAVRRALDAGVVVVAAAGNHGKNGNEDKTWPAAVPGVIAVAAVQQDGTRADFSQRGDFLTIAAYGTNVTVAAAGSGYRTDEAGTSFSAPFVSATAALVLERFPGITPAGVLRRLQATADPAPGGPKEYGTGLLNPYRALTETLGPATRAPAAPQVVHPIDPAAVALADRRAQSQRMALWFAAGGAGLVVLLAAAALIVRRGRSRGWRPAGPGAV